METSTYHNRVSTAWKYNSSLHQVAWNESQLLDAFCLSNILYFHSMSLRRIDFCPVPLHLGCRDPQDNVLHKARILFLGRLLLGILRLVLRSLVLLSGNAESVGLLRLTHLQLIFLEKYLIHEVKFFCLIIFGHFFMKIICYSDCLFRVFWNFDWNLWLKQIDFELWLVYFLIYQNHFT